MPIKHIFQSAVTDSGVSTEVSSSEWNDDHTIDDYLEMEEIAAPSTPGSGLGRLYFKSDGRVYSKDDAGTEYGPFEDSALRFIGQDTSFLSSATTSLVLDCPSGVVLGDILIAHIGIHDTAALGTLPTSWVNVPSRQEGTASGAYAHLVYKIATASEPANYTFTWTGSRFAAGGLVAYRHAHPSDPMGGSTATVQSSLTIAAPTLTPDAECRRVLFFQTIRNDTRTIQNGAHRYHLASSGGGISGVTISMNEIDGYPGATATGGVQVIATGSATNFSNIGQLVGINA